MITINGDIIRTASAKVTKEEVKQALNEYEIELTDKQFQLLMLGEEIDLSVKEIVKAQADPFATPNKTEVKKETTKVEAEVVSSDVGDSGLFDFFEEESTSTTVAEVMDPIFEDDYYIMEAIAKRGRCSNKIYYTFNSSGKAVRNTSSYGPTKIKYLAGLIGDIKPQDCSVSTLEVETHAIKIIDGVYHIVIVTKEEGLMMKYKLMSKEDIKSLRRDALLNF